MYGDVKHHREVSADELVELGVMDLMKTPADGEDRNKWITWSTAKLAVAASFEDLGDGDKPCHQVVIQNADGQGNSIAFATEQLDDGTVHVAIVSGWHQEGRVALNAEQSTAFTALVNSSIAAGLKYGYR